MQDSGRVLFIEYTPFDPVVDSADIWQSALDDRAAWGQAKRVVAALETARRPHS